MLLPQVSLLQRVAVCCSDSSANNTLPTLLPQVFVLQCVARVDIDIYTRKDRDQRDYLKFMMHSYVTHDAFICDSYSSVTHHIL